MGINHTAIGKIVKEFCRKRGLSLNRLALSLGINPIYLSNVVHGKKVSRPLIRRIAETLEIPELPQAYEEYLRTKKGNKPIQQKTKKNPIKEVRHEEISARSLSSARRKSRGESPLGGGESNADARRQEE
jgi:transcriptional regulator with XRE-family HTH domain